MTIRRPRSATTSRRQFLQGSAGLGILLGAGVPILGACGGGDDATGGTQRDPIADGLEPEAGPLRIFNFADYVAPETLAGFEAMYGVKVEVTTYDSDSEAVSRIASGAVKIDLHHSAATSTLYKYIDSGLALPLNKSYIPNFANVRKSLLNPTYDPGNQYTVPYNLFTTGIGYRADRIDPAEVEEQGWDLLWNPQFKGSISVLDDERETITMALIRKGIKDANVADPKLIEQALVDLQELIDLVNVKVNIEGYKDVPEGVTTVAHTWNSDMVGAQNYLPEGVGPEVLGFWYPADDIGVVNHDTMMVMANAEHPVLAHLYINYITDLANAETNAAWLAYLPAIEGFDADFMINQGYVPDNLRRAVTTDAMIAKGLPMNRLDSDTEILYEDTWSKFTSGG